MVFPLLPSDDIILREEVIYACGCTTTRIEHLQWSSKPAAASVMGTSNVWSRL